MHTTMLITTLLLTCIQTVYSMHKWEYNIEAPPLGENIRVHMYAPSENITVQDGTAASEKPFPLVLFMHGDPCEWWWYEYVTNFLVPNGYVVGLMASHEPAGTPYKLSLDLSYALDYIYRDSLRNPDSYIYGKLSMKAGAAGHSAGSMGALLTMGKKKEYNSTYFFDGVFAMAPPTTISFEGAIRNRVASPKVFIVGGESDCFCPPVATTAIYKQVPNDLTKMFSLIKGGTHCHFADIGIDHTCYDVEKNLCPTGQRFFTAKENQLTLDQDYLLHFFDAVLKKTKDSPEQQKALDNVAQLLFVGQNVGYLSDVMYNSPNATK